MFGNVPFFKKLNEFVDIPLVLAVIPLLAFGLVTMHSFVGPDVFYIRQLIWVGVSVLVFLFLIPLDFRFLNKTGSVMALFIGIVGLLLGLFILGETFQGARSWFDFGTFSFQPSDLAKIVLIILLAKYFSHRHIEIASIRTIALSGFYAFTIFFLVFLQPDLGSAIIIFLVWLGMVLVSGLSKKHLIFLFLAITLVVTALWSFGFAEYQKDRIRAFIDPYADIQGTGYNAFQSTIAIGSGELFGKGVGYGTQSRLQFLPEYQTDFIFAAFAEEWGFVGTLILFILFGIVFWRILFIAEHGATNFEILFGLGLAILFMSHLLVHIGMNIGVLPITGTTLPFVSYGGSHLFSEFVGLGILMSMRRYRRAAHQDDLKNEFLGPH